jgi:hypothetical protein
MERRPTIFDPIMAGAPVVTGEVRGNAWSPKPCDECGQDMWEGPKHRELIEQFKRQGQAWIYLCIPCSIRAAIATGEEIMVSQAGKAAEDIRGGVTCPRCGKTSHSHQDIASGYCGNCHDWTSNGYHG